MLEKNQTKKYSVAQLDYITGIKGNTKIRFSYCCSHLMRPHPTHQIFNRESQSRFPMEKLFRKSTAGSAHLFTAAWDEDT